MLPTDIAAERHQRGASLVEYALLIALIAVVCIGAVGFFGSSTGGRMERSGDCIVSADSPSCP